jgi:hypothetical protein
MRNDKKLEPPVLPEVSLRNVKEMAASSTVSFVSKIEEFEHKDDIEEDS